MEETTLLTTSEVARRLRVHTGTITRWCRDGYIPQRYFQKTSIRGNYRIREEWVRRHESATVKPPRQLTAPIKATRDLNLVLAACGRGEK